MCDEPTAALDSRERRGRHGAARANAVRPGRTVIVVTHDTRVFHYADSIAHMDDGRIVNVTRPNGSRSSVAPATAASGALRMKRFILPLHWDSCRGVGSLLRRADAAPTGRRPTRPRRRRCPTSQTRSPLWVLIEASTENIWVGTPLAGVVARVLGDGGPEREGRRSTLRAGYATARAPTWPCGNRPSASRAPGRGVAEARIADLAAATRVCRAGEGQARHQRRGADASSLGRRNGDAELEQARAEVTAAESQVQAVQVDLDRSVVRAPMAADVLQVKVRVGEFAPAATHDGAAGAARSLEAASRARGRRRARGLARAARVRPPSATCAATRI